MKPNLPRRKSRSGKGVPFKHGFQPGASPKIARLQVKKTPAMLALIRARAERAASNKKP